MRPYGIVLVIITMMVAILMCSGCINNNSANQQSVTPTQDVTASGLLRSGFSAFIKGDYEVALDYYNKSIAADPKYAPAWYEKGNTLIRLNRTEEAISAYDSAAAIESNIPEIWESRGEALMTLGRYAEARDSFDKALQIAPGFGKAKENRNLTLEKLK